MRQYIGARYVPRFSDVNNGIWSNIYSYEPLIIVKNGNDFYTSKIPVPTGVDINDTRYWMKTGDYNGAIVSIEEEIKAIKDSMLYVNAKDFGAAGNGSTNDTSAIQDAIDYAHDTGINKVYIPQGTYMIKCHDDDVIYNSTDPVQWHNPAYNYGVSLYSDFELFMDQNCILKSISHNRPESVMIRASECKNIYIHGGHLIGEKNNHVNSGIYRWNTDEWNVGIVIGWVDNLKIENVEIEQFTGHGLYVGAKYTPNMRDYTYTDYKTRNVFLSNLYIHDNRVVGCQLSHGLGYNISGCTFSKNKASNSEYGGGLSIEGESSGTLGIYEFVKGVSIIGNHIDDNNTGFGISLSDCDDVSITGNTINNQNNSINIYRKATNVVIDSNVIRAKTVFGGFYTTDNGNANIVFTNNICTGANIRISHGDQTADTSIDNIKISGNEFNEGFQLDSNGVDINYLTFTNNLIKATPSLTGIIIFKKLSLSDILNNTIMADNTTNVNVISAITLTNCRINDNFFARSGGKFIDIQNFISSELKRNKFGNGNIVNVASQISINVIDRSDICNNVFSPNMTHDNGTLLYVLGEYKARICNNIILAEAGNNVIPALIYVNGKNKIMYGNKAPTGTVTHVITGDNVSSADTTTDNNTY